MTTSDRVTPPVQWNESAAVPDAREAATKDRWRLQYRHPDVANVDPETFWLAWLAGANYAMKFGAKLSPILALAGECILLLTQGQDAMPTECPHCGGKL